MSQQPLKIVTFNYFPAANDLAKQWISDNGHQHVLAVTTPGPKSRPTPEYIGIVENAPRDVDILVTTRLRKVAIPLIQALEPDLIICFSFPYRIPPELYAIPKLGSVNLHPALLPAYRGPNTFRQFYDRTPEIGATLHWMAEDFDTGNILSQTSAPMPEEVTLENVFPIWAGTIIATFSEGLEKAIAGDPGTPQDNSKATYSPRYSEEEEWIDLAETQQLIQQKITGLNIELVGKAKAMIDQKPYSITGIELLPQDGAARSAGKLIEQNEGSMIVQAQNGLVRLQVTPLP